MRKILILGTAAFLLFSFVTSASAQIGPRTGQSWKCLTSQPSGEMGETPPAAKVNITLSGKGFPTQTPIYLTFCAPGKTIDPKTRKRTAVCTTTNAEYDNLLFGESHLSIGAPASFQFVTGGPKTTSTNGSVNATAILTDAQRQTHYTFYGIYFLPQETTTPVPSQSGTGGQQQGTFSFGSQAGTQVSSKCAYIRWDPYGIVFDSQSLVPLPNIRVRLLNNNKQLVVKPGLVNPSSLTDFDGAFSFIVDAGIYYLDPLLPRGYSFTATPNLNSNAENIYVNIYKPGVAIDETSGVPVRADIPLDPGSNPPYRVDPVILDATSTRIGDQTDFTGEVSQPFSIVTLNGEKTGKEYARTTASKSFSWEIIMNNTDIPQDEELIPKAIKVDLTKVSVMDKIKKFFSNLLTVSAQTTDQGFSPILAYIEGYAYDNQGKIIPNATIYVKTDMSPNGIYFQTKADAGGFFSIPNNNLPIFPFHLVYAGTNIPSVYITTTTFLQENKQYLKDHNLNLMLSNPNVNPTILPNRGISPTQQGQTNLQNNKNNVPLITAVILMLIALILLVGGSIWLYIKNKNNSQSQEWTKKP